MALGAMVERTLACKCRGGDQVDDEEVTFDKSKELYGRGLYWHQTNISWDDATLETTGLTDDQGLVELDITARAMSMVSEGDEDDASLSEILDNFVPDQQSSKKKKSFKFLPGQSQKRIQTQEASSICATVSPVVDEEGGCGFEVEHHERFEI
eukprot:CAMPEP_0113609686 /NCGR_PEP_ID=MMETSP0017_2-20120614/4627_1 /TAXON_ID=2856 /ORGANISM="Cylindrotheca closterium" /LENGTH=152 /DNA_ID=CAMNT_0000518527 /DNA_START=5 /DNA_END=463 /DNA_ORIENTATION=+ /assembly_acc=CAM_ASM_000147